MVGVDLRKTMASHLLECNTRVLNVGQRGRQVASRKAEVIVL